MKRGDRLELKVESLAFGGAGVAKTSEGLVVFIEKTAPGDIVIAEIKKKKKSLVEAFPVEITALSPLRAEPVCDHFKHCGGCKWQHISYETQLDAKKQQMIDCLERIAGVKAPPVEPVAGMEWPWRYRNKMEYTFSSFKDGHLKLGLHIAGFFDRIIDVDHCYLQTETCNEIRNAVRGFCRERELKAHNMRRHEDLLRYLVIRNSGEDVMVCLSTYSYDFEPFVDDFTSAISGGFPQIKSLQWYVNPSLSGIALAGADRLLAGADTITETILGLKMKVSAASFLQTNRSQCEKLYSLVLEAADLQGTETVFDLYTGMGPIAMLMARNAKRVIGIENNAKAVADGRKNLEFNGIKNVELIEGEAEKILPGLCEDVRPDVISVDPPRVGMHRKALETVISVRPKKIVYVSCNPSTLARDAQPIIEAGYSLIKVTPVDMFPHTAHIECVALFC